MSTHCLICESITKIKHNNDPFVVTELQTGYVVLGWHQFYRGYTLFLCKQHVAELHELSDPFKTTFLQEMALVAEAVYKAFQPEKLNYELLGNAERHLHWHLFPRYKTDPEPSRPIWVIERRIREADSTRPTAQELAVLKRILAEELEKLT